MKDEFTLSDLDVEILNKTNLLLVDDNEFNAILAVDTLHSIASDMQIDEAISGLDAIEKIREKDYDIVLMDIQMPLMNGVEATRIIRRDLDAPKK